MNPRLLDLGDGALTLEFGDRIDPALNARVMAARDALAALKLEGIGDVVPDLLFADGAFRSAAARQENPCRAPAGSRAGSCSKVGAGDTVAHTRDIRRRVRARTWRRSRRPPAAANRTSSTRFVLRSCASS
jgi:hypothetical protein